MIQKSVKDGITCRQLQLSNTMRQLWSEHVLWTRFFIVSTIFNQPDLSSVTQRLLQNPADFARELTPWYGKEKASRFNILLTDHLLIAAELVNAAKAGEVAKIEKTRKRWYQNAKEIACFLASINPYWSERKWKNLLFEHLCMTEKEVILSLCAQFEKSIIEYGNIEAGAYDMADEMSCGLIRQFCIH